MSSEDPKRKKCPTCEYFSKPHGEHACSLVSWSEWPENGGNQSVVNWLKDNEDGAGFPGRGAYGCPGYVRSKEFGS